MTVGVSVAHAEAELQRICDEAKGATLETTRRNERSLTAPDHSLIDTLRANCTVILGPEPAVTMCLGASDDLFQIAGLAAQVFDVVSTYRTRPTASQTLFAGLQEALGPFVINALRYALMAAQLRNAVLAVQAIQHDPDLLFG